MRGGEVDKKVDKLIPESVCVGVVRCVLGALAEEISVRSLIKARRAAP